MIEKYSAVKNKKCKYYKGIPYITNKDFQSTQGYSLLGITKLQKKRKKPNRKYLYYENECYMVKNKMIGMKKGYIDIGKNNYLVLKDNKFFILLVIFIAILFLFIPLAKNTKANTHSNPEPKNHFIKGILFDEQNHSKETAIYQDKNSAITVNHKSYKSKKEMISYSISFDPNGGYGNMNDMKYYNGQSIILEKNSFYRLGYTFLGWSTKRDGKVIYEDQSLISFLDSDSNNTTVLYAVWRINTYRILYHLNGGILEKFTHSYNIESNGIFIDNPIKHGYTFLGWSKKNKKEPLKDYTIQKGSYGNIHLEANYTPNQYQIHFNTNGALEEYEDKIIFYDDTYGTLPTPTRKGYTFLGWTNSQGDIVDQNTIYKDTHHTVLNANWEANVYTVTLDSQSSKLDTTSLFVTYQEKYKNLPTPTRLGYTFNGWYYKGILVNNSTIMDRNFNHVLYAKWKLNTYTITYLNPNNTVYATRQISYFDNVPTIDYSLDNYHIFNGWYDSEGKDIVGRKNLVSDLTVKANVREANCYLITGKVQDGDNSRISRFAELLAHKGLGGRWNLDSTGYYDYVSNASNYSHVRDSANYLLANAPASNYPYLRFLGMFCENGYSKQLR